MQIDLTKLFNNSVQTLNILEDVNIPQSFLSDSLLEDLKNIRLKAKIFFDDENNLILKGLIEGKMILKDDVTLEPFEYNFSSDLEEILDKKENILDITDILWHNILVEIPSKVRNTDEDIELSGNGWRLISESQYEKERSKINNPFANLQELINEKEEK